MKFKTLFMGNGNLGFPALEYLHKETHLIGIFTSYKNEKNYAASFPIQLAINNSIPYFQIRSFDAKKIAREEKLSFENAINFLKESNPDWIVVADYGILLEDWVLEIPKWACINLHASLLPKYRGASPIQAALLNGEMETGISIQKIFSKLDSGDILYQQKLAIKDSDTTESIKSILALMAKDGLAILFKKNPLEILKKAEKQIEEKASYCKKIKKEDGKIIWSKSAIRILQEIKAYQDWPKSYCFYEKHRIIIFQAKIHQNKNSNQIPGSILQFNKEAILIQCGSGILSIEILQKEAKQKMSAKEFTMGNSWTLGKCLE